jgi:hypothetical protein
MIFSLALCLLAPILSFAAFVPYVETGALATRSTSLLVPRGPCKREEQPISFIQLDGFVSKSEIAWGTYGGGFAHAACLIINHNANINQPCAGYAGIVGVTVAVIVRLNQRPDVPSEGTSTSDRRQLQIGAAETFVDSFSQEGFVWDQIETPAIEPRADYSNDIVDHFVIRGVKHANISVTPADYHYTSFVNGTGVLHVKHSAANEDIQKRHNGAGFKYNFWCSYWIPQANQPDLTQEASRLGQEIAADWSFRANVLWMDEWIGAIGIDYILLKLFGFGIRIISEVESFGENYEDVNVCGDLSLDITHQL